MFPKPLYSILPHAEAVSALSVTIDGHEFSAWHFSKVVTMFQLLLLSALTFFVWIKFLKRTDTIVLDTDWFYRRGGKAFYRLVDRPLNATNEIAHRLFVDSALSKVNRFFNAGPARLLVVIMTPYWKLQGADVDTIDQRQRALYEQARLGTFPVGLTAFLAVASSACYSSSSPGAIRLVPDPRARALPPGRSAIQSADALRRCPTKEVDKSCALGTPLQLLSGRQCLAQVHAATVDMVESRLHSATLIFVKPRPRHPDDIQAAYLV